VAGLVAAALLVPAVSVKAGEAPATLELADKTVVPVDAASLDLSVTDTSPREYPFIGWRVPVPYEQAARMWASQRFMLTGQSVNTLRVTMRQGNMTEKLLPVTKGIAGWFKKEQGAEYQGTLEIEVAIIDPNGKVLASADGKSWATETVAENATRADKEKAWMNVTKKTFDNLDRELIPHIQSTMAAYIRR
jgi:hypothetical protein